MQSYDSLGTASRYEGRLHGREWTITGEAERFAGAFSEDGERLTGTWERSADGTNWEGWMDITLTRAP